MSEKKKNWKWLFWNPLAKAVPDMRLAGFILGPIRSFNLGAFIRLLFGLTLSPLGMVVLALLASNYINSKLEVHKQTVLPKGEAVHSRPGQPKISERFWEDLRDTTMESGYSPLGYQAAQSLQKSAALVPGAAFGNSAMGRVLHEAPALAVAIPAHRYYVHLTLPVHLRLMAQTAEEEACKRAGVEPGQHGGPTWEFRGLLPSFHCADDRGLLTPVQTPVCNSRDIAAMWDAVPRLREICARQLEGSDRILELHHTEIPVTLDTPSQEDVSIHPEVSAQLELALLDFASIAWMLKEEQGVQCEKPVLTYAGRNVVRQAELFLEHCVFLAGVPDENMLCDVGEVQVCRPWNSGGPHKMSDIPNPQDGAPKDMKYVLSWLKRNNKLDPNKCPHTSDYTTALDIHPHNHTMSRGQGAWYWNHCARALDEAMERNGFCSYTGKEAKPAEPWHYQLAAHTSSPLCVQPTLAHQRQRRDAGH